MSEAFKVAKSISLRWSTKETRDASRLQDLAEDIDEALTFHFKEKEVSYKGPKPSEIHSGCFHVTVDGYEYYVTVRAED